MPVEMNTNQEDLKVEFGRVLVCLNIGSGTFISVLKNNNINYDFKTIKKEKDSLKIELSPSEYIKLYKDEYHLGDMKKLNEVIVTNNNNVRQKISIEPYSISEIENIIQELLNTGKYLKVEMPNLVISELLRLFQYPQMTTDARGQLLMKLKELGVKTFEYQLNTSQKIPLSLVKKYLLIENLEIDPFLDCVLRNNKKEIINQNDQVSLEIIKIPKNTNSINMHIQKILFGSPGTGKSHRVDNEIIPKDLKITDKNNIIKTVFHPEYTYGDFVGKLVPYTKASKVEYNFYAGHFLIALSQAYKNILNEGNAGIDNTVLVIDEINRGNSAAIFGVVFQLLDRNADGWSTFYINITELELMTILKLIGVEFKELAKNEYEYRFPGEKDWVKNLSTLQNRVDGLRMDIQNSRIYIPSNLSILATMNTSDNSIYFMDSAFKRRWDWEFIEIEDSKQKDLLKNVTISLNNGVKHQWCTFVDRLNNFIKSNHGTIRKIEDKQVGYRFINETEINEEKIRSKLMFFVWDSVFGNSKDPLIKLLYGDTNSENKKRLVTFGDFSKNTELFITKIMANQF